MLTQRRVQHTLTLHHDHGSVTHRAADSRHSTITITAVCNADATAPHAAERSPQGHLELAPHDDHDSVNPGCCCLPAPTGWTVGSTRSVSPSCSTVTLQRSHNGASPTHYDMVDMVWGEHPHAASASRQCQRRVLQPHGTPCSRHTTFTVQREPHGSVNQPRGTLRARRCPRQCGR